MLKLKYKILIATPILIVTILIGGLASLFYGVPFGNMIARHYIKNYADVKYNSIEHTIGKISYNFINSAYSASILDSRNGAITEMTYSWADNSLHDTTYNNEIDRDFQADISSLLTKSYPSIKTEYVAVGERLNASQDFTKANLKKKDMVYVWMNDDYNSSSKSESDARFMTIVKSIFNSIEGKYNGTSSQIIYANKRDKMQVLISSEQSKLPEIELLKLIKVVPTSSTKPPEVRAATVTYDNIDDFINIIHTKNLSAKFQITQTTDEGDPITQTLEYDGKIIKSTFDNTKDKFAGNGKGIITKEYQKIYKEGNLCYLLDKDGNKSKFPL